ncbi:MAG: tyrosine-type recombinase/integrase, partial [Chloroflexi bacterium]|nr:tyrosine-type recombinase/integrase [Chloroflexota bacterium]
RGILLLLARLALRAGDVVDLCLGDIDWDKAEIRVVGKSRRQTVLPLPQDVGDALHAYIATVRPHVHEEKVFLCANAPWRPFPEASNVSSVARSALDRAGIATHAHRGRGAHVFRHSRATQLLRSGATLEVIQSLLRHDSCNSTAIYAKADAVMLREVAQPWIGGVRQ